jgi:uncharacterized membrane protein
MPEEQKAPEQVAPMGSAEDTEKGKGMAWLSYIGILWLIPMLSNKDNLFSKFHVKQGILLTIAGVAIGIVGGAIPFLGWFIVAPVGSIYLLVMAIMGIINSAQGKYWTMPILGKLAANWFKF